MCRRCLAEWAVYFHLHLAESLVAKGHPEDAVQQAKVAATVAGSQGLLLQQVSGLLGRPELRCRQLALSLALV
jgi:hypothetical protein